MGAGVVSVGKVEVAYDEGKHGEENEVGIGWDVLHLSVGNNNNKIF